MTRKGEDYPYKDNLADRPIPQPLLAAGTAPPGTAHAQYMLPLDRLPSRSYQSRWGNTRPAIERISRLLERYVSDLSRMPKRDASAGEKPRRSSDQLGCRCATAALLGRDGVQCV